MEPGQRVRLVQQLAQHLAETQQRIDIDLIFRTFGFPVYENWEPELYEYCLACLQEGRDAHLLALHEDQFGFSGAPATDGESGPWVDGRFRLFLSHLSAKKQFATDLKECLATFGVDAFVAHEDIQPTAQWLEEIERALRTCHGLAALMHSGFRESAWCDQEVGFVYGRNKLVVSVRLDDDPHGFISRFQAINGRGRTTLNIAEEIVDRLIQNPKTSAEMASALVSSFAESPSFADAKSRVARLGKISTWTPRMLDEIELAVRGNDQIESAWGVPGQVDQILKNQRGDYVDEVDGDLPF